MGGTLAQVAEARPDRGHAWLPRVALPVRCLITGEPADCAALCPTGLHRAGRTRTDPDGQSACIPAQHGEYGPSESFRTDLDESHPAEHRKVGGSIPPLAIGNVQLNGVRDETPPLDASRVGASLGRVRLASEAKESRLDCSARYWPGGWDRTGRQRAAAGGCGYSREGGTRRCGSARIRRDRVRDPCGGRPGPVPCGSPRLAQD